MEHGTSSTSTSLVNKVGLHERMNPLIFQHGLVFSSGAFRELMLGHVETA